MTYDEDMKCTTLEIDRTFKMDTACSRSIATDVSLVDNACVLTRKVGVYGVDGSVIYATHSGTIFGDLPILVVPQAKSNLISIPDLADLNYSFVGDQYSMTILDSFGTVLVVALRDKLGLYEFILPSSSILLIYQPTQYSTLLLSNASEL